MLLLFLAVTASSACKGAGAGTVFDRIDPKTKPLSMSNQDETKFMSRSKQRHYFFFGPFLI
jgi:hypothetical protein